MLAEIFFENNDSRYRHIKQTNPNPSLIGMSSSFYIISRYTAYEQCKSRDSRKSTFTIRRQARQEGTIEEAGKHDTEEKTFVGVSRPEEFNDVQRDFTRHVQVLRFVSILGATGNLVEMNVEQPKHRFYRPLQLIASQQLVDGPLRLEM
ncbi:MAG: hypothetical protein LBK46_07915 [Oscillospiraceae bacterium]|jgi:hypothetical protein|nr:hypothetical protein [Oscillospiraceae bacterium]